MKYGDGVRNKGTVNFEEPQEKGERWVGAENLAYVMHVSLIWPCFLAPIVSKMKNWSHRARYF